MSERLEAILDLVLAVLFCALIMGVVLVIIWAASKVLYI